MNSLLFTVGLFLKIWFFDNSVYLQPNNKYMWIEYHNEHRSLKEKEVVKISDVGVLTIGVN